MIECQPPWNGARDEICRFSSVAPLWGSKLCQNALGSTLAAWSGIAPVNKNSNHFCFTRCKGNEIELFGYFSFAEVVTSRRSICSMACPMEKYFECHHLVSSSFWIIFGLLFWWCLEHQRLERSASTLAWTWRILRWKVAHPFSPKLHNLSPAWWRMLGKKEHLMPASARCWMAWTFPTKMKWKMRLLKKHHLKNTCP